MPTIPMYIVFQAGREANKEQQNSNANCVLGDQASSMLIEVVLVSSASPPSELFVMCMQLLLFTN